MSYSVILYYLNNNKCHHAQSLAKLDLSVDIGYYNTTKELFRALLFHVRKETNNNTQQDR